jgi:DNA-directed RNA polymerase subunit RPC12/RpoP
MENDKFITILTGTFVYEIAVVRSRLESEGIICFVPNELTAQVVPHYSNAVGGVKLQVRESDLTRALEILREAEHSLIDEETEAHQTEDQQTIREKSDIVCPFCGSDEVVKTKRAGWVFLLTSLLILFPTPFLKRKYYCFDCKQEFKHQTTKRKPIKMPAHN